MKIILKHIVVACLLATTAAAESGAPSN